MIPISELRIGSCVLCNGLRTKINNSLMKDIINNEIIWTIEPIQLTEKILLDSGFEKVIFKNDEFYSEEYHLQVNKDVFISYSDDFSCGLWSSKDRMEELGVLPKWDKVKYVHGLQNLVQSLTGKDLEVRL